MPRFSIAGAGDVDKVQIESVSGTEVGIEGVPRVAASAVVPTLVTMDRQTSI